MKSFVMKRFVFRRVAEGKKGDSSERLYKNECVLRGCRGIEPDQQCSKGRECVSSRGE